MHSPLVVMPSRFCLLPGLGTLPLAQGLASWPLQASTTDRPLAPHVPTPSASQWSQWLGRGKTSGLCWGTGCLREIRKTTEARCWSVCVSTPCAKAGQLSLEAVARVLVKCSPSTCHPGESGELFQGILTQSLFTLSSQPPWPRPDFSTLLSWVGPVALRPGPPLSPTMTKCQVLISHLLQYRLCLEKDFFRSLVMFLYSF